MANSLGKKVMPLWSQPKNQDVKSETDSFGHQRPNHVVGSFQNQCVYLKDKNYLANRPLKTLVRIEGNIAAPSTFKQTQELVETLSNGRFCDFGITDENTSLQQSKIIHTEMKRVQDTQTSPHSSSED